MFKRHLLRKAKERLESQCDLMLAAINANSNYDGEETADAKRERIKQIEDSTKEAIALIYQDPEELAAREAADPYSVENDPLFRNVRRMREEAQPPLPEQAGMGHNMMARML
jgi:hypothetical protein